MKNEAAVELGRRGGLKGGKHRARLMTQAERRQSARDAAIKRWGGPTCPVCGRGIQIDVRGIVRGHFPPAGRDDLRYQPPGRQTYCRGSNERPVYIEGKTRA